MLGKLRSQRLFMAGFVCLIFTVFMSAQGIYGQNLSKIYRGGDGSAMYLRVVDNKVYGFAEHPGQKYAYVLTGARQGDTMTAKFRDIPKGTRTNLGDVELQFSQAGARIVRKSGSTQMGTDRWDEISAGSFPYPGRQEAGFQKTKGSDLDGVFLGEDGSRHYVRQQTDGELIWVAEQDAQPGVRPAWVSVFVGKRNSSDGISGTYADVPKGLGTAKGTFGSAFVGDASKRSLALSQTGITRNRKLEPHYAIDWNAFADSLKKAFDGKVVGYSYAIGQNGVVLRSGAGGNRKLAVDGKVEKFTVDTFGQAASTTKTITAVALVKALHSRNIKVDSSIAPHLPSCWKQGPGMSSVTFRQIMDHTSGLSEPSCREDPYACLMKLVETGSVNPKTRNYNNTAYALMRYLVPFIAENARAKGQFNLFKCKNPNDELNKDISVMFNEYIFEKVLAPAGATASYYPGKNFALNYNFADQSVAGSGPRADFGRRGGAGYLAISAPNYLKFIGALDRGDLLPESVVQGMYSGNLGFDGSASGSAGAYPTKNGGCPDKDGEGRGCGAQVMVYPGGIQAYVMVNSGNNQISGNLPAILRDAFDSSLK